MPIRGHVPKKPTQPQENSVKFDVKFRMTQEPEGANTNTVTVEAGNFRDAEKVAKTLLAKITSVDFVIATCTLVAS